MVTQGDIIRINFNPQEGHEQAGQRPAVVVSNEIFNARTKMTLVCPITRTNRSFPLHIPLDERTLTVGVVLCEHIRSLDLYARGYQFVERIPPDLLKRILQTLHAQTALLE